MYSNIVNMRTSVDSGLGKRLFVQSDQSKNKENR